MRSRKREVLREAAERDVLAVVGRRLRVALARGQRLHRAAERRPRLVERDVGAGVDEVERGGEPGEPAADDGDPHASSPRATIASFVRVEGAARRRRRRSRAPRSVERRAVEPGERRDAERAAAVEEGEQAEPVCRVSRGRARPGRRQPAPAVGDAAGGDVRLGHAERGQLVLRQVDAAEPPVLRRRRG